MGWPHLPSHRIQGQQNYDATQCSLGNSHPAVQARLTKSNLLSDIGLEQNINTRQQQLLSQNLWTKIGNGHPECSMITNHLHLAMGNSVRVLAGQSQGLCSYVIALDPPHLCVLLHGSTQSVNFTCQLDCNFISWCCSPGHDTLWLGRDMGAQLRGKKSISQPIGTQSQRHHYTGRLFQSRGWYCWDMWWQNSSCIYLPTFSKLKPRPIYPMMFSSNL